MKKLFCLLACLCGFSLNGMGKNSPFINFLAGVEQRDCMIHTPRPVTPDSEDDNEVSRYSGEFIFPGQNNPRDCVIPTPKKDDDGDNK